MKRKSTFFNIFLLAMLSLLSTMTVFASTVPVYENKATADTVTIDNRFVDSTTTSGAITLKANTFASGDTVTIIDAKKVKLGEVKIENAANAYNVNVTLTRKSGAVGIYVTPNTTDFKVSKTNMIKYLAQKSPVVNASNITITGNADKDDVLTMTGVESGDTVNVYKATATDTEKPIAKGTSKGTSVEVKLGKNNISVETGIKVSITKKDCLESEKLLIKGTSLNYTVAPVSTAIANVILVKEGVLVSGLSPKDVINVYSADPTQYLSKYPSAADKTALKAILLGTKVANAKDNYIFIPFKSNLADGASVYITKKTPNKTVTILSNKTID